MSAPRTLGEGHTHPPNRPWAHHDDSYHDGCNTDEVQLPREELIDFLMAILLQEWPEGSNSQWLSHSHHPTRWGLCPTAYLPSKNKLKTHGPARLLYHWVVSDLTSTLGLPVCIRGHSRGQFPRILWGIIQAIRIQCPTI